MQSRGLEFSGAAAAILLIAYACIGVWSLILLRDRSRMGSTFRNGICWRPFFVFRGFMRRRTCCSSGIRCRGLRKVRLRAGSLGSLFWLWLVPLILGCRLLSRSAHRATPGAGLPVERPRLLASCLARRLDRHEAVDWRSGSCVDGQRECRSEHHDANSGNGYLHQHAWHLQRA